MNGHHFYVFLKKGTFLFMMDKLGNENYQPMLIAVEGGIPEKGLGDRYQDEKLACVECDLQKNIAYFDRDDRKNPEKECLRVNLTTGDVTSLGRSLYGNRCAGINADHSKIILGDGYTAGDVVLFYREPGMKERKLLYGVPLEERGGGETTPPQVDRRDITDGHMGLLFVCGILFAAGGLFILWL